MPFSRMPYIHCVLVRRIYGSRNQEVEFTIAPNDPVGGFVLPKPTTLGSAGVEALVPKEGKLSSGDTA